MKIKLPTLTKEFLVNQIVSQEQKVRQMFLKGRKSEIDTGFTFTVGGLELKPCLLSLQDREEFEIEEGHVGCRLMGVLTIQLTKKGKSREMEGLVMGEGGAGVACQLPFTNSDELHAFLREAAQELNELVQMMYTHWRTMKPLLKDYLVPEETKMSLVLWTHEKQSQFVWASTYAEVRNVVGTDEGMVRPFRLNEEVKRPLESRLATPNELYLLMEGTFGSTSLLHVCIEEEQEEQEMKRQLCESYPYLSLKKSS